MGSISSQIQQDDADSGAPAHLINTEIKVDFSKSVNPNLKQLLYWSPAEVRAVYEKFRQRNTIPYMDKSIFCHIVPFTRMNAKFIFQNLCKDKTFLNIFELLCLLTMGCYTHYINKIHLLFLVFDFDCSDSIQLEELIIIFICFVQGFCKLTDTTAPSFSSLEKFSKLMFLKSDIQADNELSLPEIIEWVEGNMKAMEVFSRFEPDSKIRENIEIFKHFKKYEEEEGAFIMNIIKKASKSHFFYNNLDLLLNQIKSFEKVNLKDVVDLPTTNFIAKKTDTKAKTGGLPKLMDKYGIGIMGQSSINKQEFETKKKRTDEDEQLIDLALNVHSKNYTFVKNKNKKDDESLSTDSQDIPKNFKSKFPIIKKNTKKKIVIQPKNEKNLIIIKGETITKNEVYKLKDYFDKLSDKNKSISIKDFSKAFSEKSHMKSVIPSLFNFLDKKAKGYVTFEELALRIYPTLTRKNLSTINKWVKGYSKILQRDQKSLLLKEEKEDEGINKKKILPKSTLKRFYEIFELFDEERKGYLTLQNLKSSFTFGFSPKEIEDLFNEHDKDKDGFLQIEDFIRILLPSDYIIDDHDEQN